MEENLLPESVDFEPFPNQLPVIDGVVSMEETPQDADLFDGIEDDSEGLYSGIDSDFETED